MKNEELISINKSLGIINGSYQKWYQKNKINSYLLQTMYVLYNVPTLSQKEISENYQIPPQTVNNAIKTLEKEGYLKLVPDERDRRWRKIVITEEGAKYIEESVKPLAHLDNRVVEKLGMEKYRQLISLLKDYGEALQEELNESDNN